MKTKLITACGLLILLTIIAYSHNQTESAQPGRTVGSELVYTAEDLPQGTFENLTVTEAGLVLEDTAVTGRYLSPILDAPLPFSALVPYWQEDVPESGSFSLQVRTGVNGQWDDWVLIEHNEDWSLPDEDETIGQMITVSADDKTHDRFQFVVSFGRYGQTPSPLMQELGFSFIDASQGPSSAEMVALQAELDQENPSAENGGYPKPPVISRSVWCTDPACNYTDGLSYYPVSHLLLHHTVSNNNSSDWAAVMRAIWYFHTFTRGWGDIGYNYLVDMNGNLYEGHLGGDDVVGTHAAGANAGSMALSLIGTFTNPNDNPPGITPPPAMLNAAAELFAWKADQKNIDVYGAGTLPYLNWGLPYLSGHRDVYGTTVCPGAQAHLLLPWLRDEVADRIGFISPNQYIDELSPAFTRSGGAWNVTSNGCGNNGHAYYAWSTTNPNDGVVWGEWRPNVVFPGTYEIEVYAPYCITGAPETDGATYEITDQNGTSTVVVSHDDNVGNWMSLGQYSLATGTNTLVRLTNLTTTDSNLGVWFDAIRLRPILISAATNLSPEADSWQPRNVTFNWSLTNQATISSVRLQVSEDATFDDLLLDVPLPTATTSYNHTFGQDYVSLHWQVLVTTTQNGSATSLPTSFGIDTAAPTSLVTNIYHYPDDTYRIFWSGTDDTSGIDTYTIQYRDTISGTWTNWLTDTTQTSALYTPPYTQTIWFRSQAVDVAGNIEPPHADSGDINTDQALSITRAIMLPVVFKQ